MKKKHLCRVIPSPVVIGSLCILLSVTLLSSCKPEQKNAVTKAELPYVPSIVTGEIKAGIEKHIAAEVERGQGYFKVPFEGKELKLKLVRVHVEYLASLAPQLHFACVDMVSSDDQFYDIDFFMKGVAGALTVSETSVHKLNGTPYYLWKQNKEKTWVRTPVEGAAGDLLGVLTGHDAFEFRYQATLPDISGPARCWLPMAQSDSFQKVTVRSVNVPGRQRILTDRTESNRILFLELGPEDRGKQLEIIYDVDRFEKSAYPGDSVTARKYLRPERMVPSDEKIEAAAQKAVDGKQGDLMRARALYDHVLDQMRYKKAGEGWGKGDAVYACDVHSGNCTDYHSYFIGLARSIGIPARFAIGAAIPSERNDGGTDGYHCWAEFYAEGKWWPVDISEADKFTALSMYFFGHHPANRFEFTHGRDLVLDPGPVSGDINFLAYPLLEIEGKPVKVTTLFLFRRTTCDTKSKGPEITDKR